MYESSTSRGSSQENGQDAILDQLIGQAIVLDQGVSQEIVLGQDGSGQENSLSQQQGNGQRKNGQETEEEDQPGPSQPILKPLIKKRGRPSSILETLEETPGPSRLNRKKGSRSGNNNKKKGSSLPGEYPFQLSSSDDEKDN